MEKSSNQGFYTLLKKHEGKKIKILTKNNLHYFASNLKVFPDSIAFSDKFGSEIILALDEISQVTGVNENGD